MWLANSPESWLLILDNADEPSLDVLSYLPAGSRGTIIITTRNPELKSLETVGSCELAGMGADDAVSLFFKASGLKMETEGKSMELAVSIVTILGCLALAIIQAGATIRQKRCTLEDFGETYANSRRALLSRTHTPTIIDYKYTVYTTWEISIGMIEEEGDEISSHALDLLCCFSFMHCANISEEIFKRASINLRSGVFSDWTTAHQLSWLAEKATPSTWNPAIFRDSLHRLVSFSLITMDESNSISLHPLVHAWAKDRMTEADHAKWAVITASTIAMSVGTTDSDDDVRSRRTMVAHFHSCLISMKNMLFCEGEGIEDRLNIAEKFALVFIENKLMHESVILRQKIVESRKILQGLDAPETLTAMELLARSYFFDDQLQKAFEVESDVVDRRINVLGKDNEVTLHSRSTLCAGYLQMGRYKEVLEMELEICDTEARILGEDHVNTLFSIYNLAHCYLNLCHYQEALPLAVKLLEARQKRFQKDHPDVLLAANLLAHCYYGVGRFQEACNIGRDILEIEKQTQGQESMETLLAMGNLAVFMVAMGQYRDALTLEEEILNIGKKVYGDNHSRMVTHLSNIAMIHHLLGHQNEAIELGETAEALAKKILPQEHPDTLTTMYVVGRFYQSAGRLEEAENRLKDVLDKLSKTLGEDSEATRSCKKYLADVYGKSNRLIEAQELLEEVLTCRENSLGKENPITLDTKRALIDIYNQRGRAGCVEMAKDVLEKENSVFGPEHPDTLKTKLLLTECFKSSGRLAEATLNQEQLVSVISRVLGEKHPRTAEAIEILDSCRDMLSKQRQGQDASSGASIASKSELGEKTLAEKTASLRISSDQERARTDLEQLTSDRKSKSRWDLKALLKKR